jgi:hypothetical protein
MNDKQRFDPRRRVDAIVRRLVPVVMLVGLSGCAAETLFLANFKNDAVGSPPATNQNIGTVQFAGAPGSVVVVNSVPNSNAHWVKISRASIANNQAPITELRGKLIKTYSAGSYGFLAAIFIPSGSGLATVEFDTSPVASPPSAEFLHLDFLENGKVRFDDNPSVTFGNFPHDKFFTLSVNMEITATTAVAHVTLFGAGTSGGTFDYTIQHPNFAREYGAIKLWMGFPWTGSFDMTDVLVTRKK